MNNQFSILDHNKIQVLKVQNLLSEFENKKMLAATQPFLDKGNAKFVVDLSRVDYMNSVGLNFLIKLKKRTKKVGGGMAVVNASDKVLHLLKITKLTQLFKLTDSIEEAIQSLATNE